MALVGRRILFGEISSDGVVTLKLPRRSKYGNVRVSLEGLKFDSKREANRYRQLKLLLHGNRIRKLRRQVRYKLFVNEQLICAYVADFVYEDYQHGEWVERVEDSKGKRTPVYLIKKNLMRAILGIEIIET